MMSLTEVSIADSVKRQYKFKLKSYIGAFTTLIAVQVVAMLFSSTGTGGYGTSSESYSINVSYYSANLIIAFTMLWSFITSVLITTKAYRYEDFMFVTNRLTSSLSNVLFLLTASIVGGISAMFAGYLQKIYLFYISEGANLISATTPLTELVIGLVAASLYMLLFSALGYFVGMLTQLHKLFIVIIPTVFLGSLFLSARHNGEVNFITKVIELFIQETSLLLFAVKVLTVAAALFYGSLVICNRLEVRR
ncbi:hypothetical protein [Bacillus suaedaesalsae]|uniref:ABC transporter permease n=1 Tax=Bacillus suaedaesalsae TaxID=2810349 RepID=A0ABS2DG38_9BACI|nr:hypothetical protein [Bacillus suaedaesalsae]MBM6617414.1 hypothetical protein [Bacillus suaedaesalsae]